MEVRVIRRGDEDGIEVSRPLVESGTWPRPGEILLERSFARFHHLEPGDRLEVGGSRVTVSGIGIIALGDAYPQVQPGRAFALDRTIATIAPDRRTWTPLIGLRIADPVMESSWSALAM